MRTKTRLAVAAIAFGLLASTAGGLQMLAYAASDRPRHLILAIFALSVGVSVLVYGVRTLRN